MRRLLAAASAAVLLSLVVASATTLGQFGAPILSGTSEDFTPCTADVDLLDDLVNVIPLNVNLGSLTVNAVRINTLEGDCLGTAPQVVVIGEDPPLSADEVLDISDPLSEITTLTVPNTLVLDAGDSLRVLFDGLSLRRITELRMAFVP